MEEQFIEFLKEHKVKLAFQKELLNHRGITINKYLSRYSWRRMGVGKVLQNAFKFIETEQGREFWMDINNQWKQYVNSLKP